MKLYNILKNIINKIEQNVNVEAITNSEIDSLFGSAAGTGTDAQDYVIEYVLNDSSGYAKWASGKLECWVRIYRSITVSSSWGSLYYGSTSAVTYPHAFTVYPVVSITIQSAAGNLWCAGNYDNYTLTNTGQIYAYSTAMTGTYDCTLNIKAVGRWK